MYSLYFQPAASPCAVCIHASIQVHMAEHRTSLVELQMKEELEKRYCDENGFVHKESLLALGEARESWYSEITGHLQCQRNDLTADVFNSRKANKETLCQWLENADDLFERYELIIKDLLNIVDKSKSALIMSQQKVVNLQEELLEKKKEELCILQSNVSTTVENSVKQEIRSFSEVLKSAPNKAALSEDRLKTVVRSAIDDDDRSRNLIIYGMEEEHDDHLSEKASSMFEKLGGFKPYVEVCRIGKKTAGKSARPVKVVFSNTSTAKVILSRAKNLRQFDLYKSVYISPDRSPEERQTHKQLVLLLKSKRDTEQDSYHFIRGGKICSVRKTDNNTERK